MPMEYIVPKLHIATFIDLTDCGTKVERMLQLLALEEDRFMVGFHQQVQKGMSRKTSYRQGT